MSFVIKQLILLVETLWNRDDETGAKLGETVCEREDDKMQNWKLKQYFVQELTSCCLRAYSCYIACIHKYNRNSEFGF